MWDRRCGVTGEEREGWITVCGTGVVVLLVKRVRMDHSVWDRRCGDTGEENEGRTVQCVGQALW